MSLQIFTTVSTRLELRSYSTIPDERVIAVIGLTTPWDIPTEIWTFDASSTALDDGVKVLKPNDILVGSPGRFLFRANIVRQFGSTHSKEFNGALTVSGNTAVFNISSAGFINITNIQATAVLSSGTVVNLPLASISAQSLASVTVNLLDSKNTSVLILNTSVEGLENHSVAGTIVYLTVKGN